MTRIDNQKQVESSPRELLLADHKYLCDSFRENEQIGERRIKFYITLVTAVMAGCATLATSNHGIGITTELNGDKLTLVIIFFSLFFLLVTGIITLLRMIQRNKVTDGYKKDLDEIRQIFKDYYDEQGILEYYTPFGPRKLPAIDPYNKEEDKGHPEETGKNKGSSGNRKFGGLTHMTSGINSIVIAGLTGVLLAGLNIYIIIAAIVVVFVLSFLGQHGYIKKHARENKERIRRSEYSHTGGIVYRLENNKLKFLVITAKENRDHFVFPKGHIEKFEEHRTTAVREVLEETGVLAQVKRPVGSICFMIEDSKGNRTENRIKFYLMEFLDQLKTTAEGRELLWREYSDAKDLLSFPDSAELLVKAKSIIESNSPK